MAFEWQTVETTEFTNPMGNITDVKLIHEIPDFDDTYEADREYRDLALVAFLRMKSVDESLRLMEANARQIAEYDFDISRISKLIVPL